jgi:hypothetical protein
MHRSFTHRAGGFVAFFLLLVFFTTKTFAQEQIGPVTDDDSVILSVQYDEDSETLFNLISDTAAIQGRSVPDSIVKKMQADGDYWYVNIVPERQKQKQIKITQEQKWYQKDWFANLLWFLIIGSFVAILIWFLASSNIKLFRKRPAAISSDGSEITEETIFSFQYAKEIKQAIADQNYRLAIRLWYLRTLKDLAEQNIIQYKQDKTNSDYVNELHETPYYKNFFGLTRNFEYTWYGKFHLSPDAFALLQKDFVNFKQQLQ